MVKCKECGHDDSAIAYALNSLPEKIKLLEDEVLLKQQQIDDASQANRLAESAVYFQVDSMVDSEGKKLFSNEIKRKFETDRRLEESIVFRDNRSKVEKLSKELKVDVINLDFLKRKFRAVEAFSRLGE